MAYTICSTCNERPAQPGQRKCKECHAAYMRQWRARLVSLRLDDDDYEWVRQRSAARSQSYSEIVSEALALLRQADEQAAVERGVTRMVRQARQSGGGGVSRETKRA